MSFIFGAEGLPKTPQELARMRAVANAMRKRRNPKSVGEGMVALGEGIASGLVMRQANNAEKQGRAQVTGAYNSILSAMMGGGGETASAPVGAAPATSYSSSIPGEDLETDPVNRRINQGFSQFGTTPDADAPENWASIRQGIFDGESKGDYDALFGFSNQEGGRFADTKLTDMTVDEALAFSDPAGAYGQWVKGQVGRVATPMGAYQVVGTTLRGAKEKMGLRGDERMTPDLQERIGHHIYRTQGAGAWEGYKGPRAPSDQYAALNPTVEPQKPAIDPKGLLVQKLTKLQGRNVSANPVTDQVEQQPLEAAQAQPSQGAQRVAQAQQGLDLNKAFEVMNNPWLSPGQKTVLKSLIDREMQSRDPLRQMQLEKGQLELDKLRNPGPPDSVRALTERARLAGLQSGTPEYADFMTSGGKSGVTVNVGGGSPGLGKLSTDYGYVLGADGKPVIDKDTGLPQAAAVPGSPAAQDEQKAVEAAKIKQASVARSGNVVLEDIDRALVGLDEGTLPTSGAFGGVLSNIPGTQAFDVGQLIETVKANSGFDRLQAMRDASPTGGALGAINQSEMGLLQAALGNLSQSQSADQLKFNLRRVRQIYSDIVNGPEAAQQSPQAAAPTPNVAAQTPQQQVPQQEQPLLGRIRGMGREELQGLDRSQMSVEELKAAAERYRLLMEGNQ